MLRQVVWIKRLFTGMFGELVIVWFVYLVELAKILAAGLNALMLLIFFHALINEIK